MLLSASRVVSYDLTALCGSWPFVAVAVAAVAAVAPVLSVCAGCLSLDTVLRHCVVSSHSLPSPMSLPELSSSDLSSIHSLLTAALSEHNDERQSAERSIDSHLTNHPAAFILSLLHVVSSSPADTVRSLAAILLRRELTRGEPIAYEQLPEHMQAAVKSALLASLLHDPSLHVRNLLGDAIAELANCLLYKGEWAELVPLLCDMARNGRDEQVVLALSMLGKLAKTIDNIEQHVADIASVLSSCMAHPSIDAQCASVDTICKLLSQAEVDEQRKGLSKAFPAILALLVRLVQSGDEERSIKVIGSLLELLLKGEGEGELMKSVMDRFAVLMSVSVCAGTPILRLLTSSLLSSAASSLSGFLSSLSSSSVPLTADLRHMCMEWLVSFCEDQPRLVRRSKSFISATLLSAFSLLLSATSTPLQQWAAGAATEEDEGEESVAVGLMAVARLAEAVQGAKLGPILLPLYHSMSSSPSSSWEYQHAAIHLVTQAGEVLPFEDLPIPSILAFLSSSHPRVRYAAVECVGQLALDFKPHLQEQSHEQCFSALLPCLTSVDWPRVQCMTAIAYYNLCVDLEESVIDLYAASLLDVLLSLLTNSVRAVQEQVLQTIGAVATASPNVFATYYQRVMALLKHVIVEAKGKELAMLRARAMEAATMIGQSVSREQFRPDAIELTHLFLQLMQQEGEAGEMGLAADDVSEQFLLQAWTRIASVMGEEFSPMLERLLPALFKAAAQHVDGVLRIEGAEEDDEERMIAFEQSLEDKTNALRMLNAFAMDLPAGMFPFVGQCTSIVLPLLSYYLSLDIRSYAITLLPLLLKSALTAYKAGRCDVPYVRSLLAAIVSAFLDRFKAEESTELKELLVSALRDCVEDAKELGIARDTIDAAGLSIVGEALMRMLEVSRKHIEAVEAKMEAEEEDEDGMDEESMMTMEATIAKEDSLHYVIADCVGTLIKSHGRLFRPTFERLREEILSVLVGKAGEKSKCVSVYLFDDLLEFGELDDKADVDGLLASFMPHVIDFVAPFAPHSAPASASSAALSSSSSSSSSSAAPLTRQSASLRQACAYGLGACASYHAASFSPYVDRAAHQLVAAIDSREGRLAESEDEERVSFSDIDNCISALGKLATMDSLATDVRRAAMLHKWLFALPLRDDYEEGESVYGQLVELVERHDTSLLQDESAVLQVLYVLSSAVNTNFVGGEDSELNQRVLNILNEMKRHGYGGSGSGHKSKLQGMSSEQRQKVQQVLEAI